MDIGTVIKNLRTQKKETLHQVSMGTNIDVTLLSKFERNVRLPTTDQIERICIYYNTSKTDLMALVVSQKIINEYGLNKITTKAINLVSEQLSIYNADSEVRNED